MAAFLKALLEQEFPVNGSDIFQLFEDNDVNWEVFLTMSEGDLKEIGVNSFGIRRKLKILIEKFNQIEETEQGNAYSPRSEVFADVHPVSPAKKLCAVSPGSCSYLDDSLPSKVVANIHPVPLAKKMCTVSPDPCSFLNLNLEDELSVSTDGKALVRQLQAGNRPTAAERRLLVRVAVAALVQRGNNGLWPSSTEKTELAKLITNTFPSTRDTTEGMSGHELFYHNSSGFIEYRLKTVRQKLRPEQMRKRRSAQGTGHGTATQSRAQANIEENHNEYSDQKPDSKQLEMIYWMKYTAPKKENKPQMLQFFRETYAVRRRYIETSKHSITEIMDTYPCFKDSPEMINLEFGMMHKEQEENFVSKWPSFREAILKVGAREYPSIQRLITNSEGGNVDLCGLSTLVYILHHSVNKKTSKYGSVSSSSRARALQHLIQHIPEGTDISDFMMQNEAELKHPYLLSTGKEAKNPTQFFLVLDCLVIPGALDLIQAFDRLFKAHYVFSVEYSPVLQNFWEFIDFCIYSVKKPVEAKSKLRDVASAIKDAMAKE